MQLIRNQQVVCSSHITSSTPRGITLGGLLFSPYVSPNLAANREELESDLALINEDLGRLAQNGVDKEPALQYNKKDVGIFIENKAEYAVLAQALAKKNGEKPRRIEYAYTAENFYVVTNNKFGNFKPILQLNIENNTELIKDITGEINNGTYRNSKTVAEWVRTVQRRKRSYDSDIGSFAKGRADVEADGLYDAKPKYNRRGYIGKDGGNQSSRVSIFDGELSEKAKKEYTNLKRAANNLNSVAGDNFNIAIVNADADFNGVTVKGKNIYISAELLESGYWAPTLIHELTHFTEGSPEYNKFARFLLSSNPAAAAYKASELTAEGNAYGFTRENVEREFGGEGDITSGRRALQYSKNENFKEEIDEWNKDGKPEDGYFVLGTTGDVLQGLGAIESDIYMLTDKINAILHDHPEITLDEIKRIPDILEDPVLILKSHNVGRKGKANTRLVIFGSVKAKNGQPMLSVLDLRPNEKNLIIEDMQKLTSAYTKTQNPVEFIGNSDIVYADKKRTTPLLRTIGFQMPIELNESGSIGSISYKRQFVNILGKKFLKS